MIPTPDQIAASMDGSLREVHPGRREALIPSPCIQNHVAFQACGADGLHCLWFGGSLEAKSDISIHGSTLGAASWRAAERLSDPNRSEQNPVQFEALCDELGDGDARPNAEGGCEPGWGVPRAPQATCPSDDGGLSFPRRVTIDDSPGTCLSNNSLDGGNRELSYPSIVEAPDGTIDLAHTYFRRAVTHVQPAPGRIDA